MGVAVVVAAVRLMKAPFDTAFAAAVMVAVVGMTNSQSRGQIHRPFARARRSPLAAPQPLLQPPFAAPFFCRKLPRSSLTVSLSANLFIAHPCRKRSAEKPLDQFSALPQVYSTGGTQTDRAEASTCKNYYMKWLVGCGGTGSKEATTVTVCTDA